MIGLVHDRLPLTITADGHDSPQEDWRVVRTAFLARITRTAEALSALVPLGTRIDAMNLARNLLEHVACLAWIAADPDTRFDVWLKRDYMGRLKHDREIRERKAAGKPGRWPEEPLADSDRLAYEWHVGRVRARFPKPEEMFQQADYHWLPKYPAGLANHRAMSFVDQYTHIYDVYSWMSHPRLTGLQAFWEPQTQWSVVHTDEIGQREHDPLHMGQLLFGQGLLISGLIWGVPRVDDVVIALDETASLAALVKQGRIVTVETRPGVFRLAPAASE